MNHPAAIRQFEADLADLPDDTLGLEPRTVDDMAWVLRYATEQGMAVDVRGGGTHHGYGRHVVPDIVISMAAFDRVEAWDPDDLTVVVGAGMPVAELEAMLNDKSQTAVLPEHPGDSTVGGVISAGLSSLRRGRLLGTRERVLEVTLVTGDGRIVTAGGRVVKNVTGYDLPRTVVGAFGSLGVVTTVCLKVLPIPPAAVTIDIIDERQAHKISRPLAVLETGERLSVFHWGTAAEIASVTGRIEGSSRPFLDWPADPLGPLRWSLRVPPALTKTAMNTLPAGWRFLAVHGVGEIRLASDSRAGAAELRQWAESVAGFLVVTDAPPASLPDLDPWGKPPPGLELQRRLIAQFDPRRVINPGRLPGGL